MTKLMEAYRAAQVIRRPQGRDPSTYLYTVAQVAAMRSTRVQNVRHAIMCGQLPAWYIGNIYLIPRADAEEWALRKATVISQNGRTKELRGRRLAKLWNAAARRALVNGDTLPHPDAPPEVPGRCR